MEEARERRGVFKLCLNRNLFCCLDERRVGAEGRDLAERRLQRRAHILTVITLRNMLYHSLGVPNLPRQQQRDAKHGANIGNNPHSPPPSKCSEVALGEGILASDTAPRCIKIGRTESLVLVRLSRPRTRFCVGGTRPVSWAKVGGAAGLRHPVGLTPSATSLQVQHDA